MKQQYQAFIARIKERGGKLIMFSCPLCHGEIETPAAPLGDVWDSISTCPHCTGMFVKYVCHINVTTKPMPQEESWQK
ncbi:TPA: hypothetical protein ACNFPO_004438 [Citrobacter freundii]|nr:hypothetical protein [Escherichia coli]HCG2937271.1 hypothetical protein [Escherichia coli]HCG3100379.1 hypothetical protein [Escherichia coli]